MKLTAMKGITALALIALCVPACSRPSPIPWNASTEFRFTGLMDTEAPRVERVFRAHDLAFRQTSETPITYEVTGINTVRELAYVHRDLRTMAQQNNISMPLERATLNFGGLAASGSVLTRVTINITPGAQALVADRPIGAPWRLVQTNSAGRWEGHVNTKGIVAKNGGWVYIAAVRRDITRYYRVNILSSEQQHVSFAGLKAAGLTAPTPGDLAAPIAQPRETNPNQAAEDKSAEQNASGFKWPWQK